MKKLIVFAHQHQESFNRAILDQVESSLREKGQEVIVRDLYKTNFQPVLKPEDTDSMKVGKIPEDIKIEQDFISESDVIIFIYPIWWSNMPAILKGYLDRVFSFGFAYTMGDQGAVPLLKGKKGLIINTYGASEEQYESIGMNRAFKTTMDVGVFGFTGIEPVDHLLFGSVTTVDDLARKEMLGKVRETLNKHF
ncbi:NAD(P)H-dependent oxidoreductase [Desulfosporosinus meridiei]|uniref:Putative NADPH-quinone reductase (Modulator of drug activity B) n=1 Tax=Desulfosporosinus meridiei (strain ATCC BAA-275 / DSM 13257 / KCTC 12902 / NCIMB 13706 / S10) TaxID=768704 RepID=J7J1K4_DESMD|nr:NAD(P)H-dependent oxidoreductase [Desulfosporosinus meridiei]AFQ44816.1 putative NADPH-quinone reductase (modulator of drug activity B) [Desulfosporosinus meridiei DSM 13257]